MAGFPPEQSSSRSKVALKSPPNTQASQAYECVITLYLRLGQFASKGDLLFCWKTQAVQLVL